MNQKKTKIRIYLNLEEEFYFLLKKKADGDFLKVPAWTKQFIMKTLLGDDNNMKKEII